MWRSSREKEGSTSSNGWRRSGTPAVPAGRLECCVEKSSRSRRPRPFRSTPTVRSRAGFRSSCAAAKARYACSHELAADVDPRAHMDREAGERSRHLALAERDQELLRPDERRHVDVGPPDFDRAVRIAAHTAGEVVRTREFERPNVARRCDLAGVEHLDDVELWRDALEDRSAKVPPAVAAERVRDVREPALLVDQVDGVIGGKSRRDHLLEVEANELAVGGRDP